MTGKFGRLTKEQITELYSPALLLTGTSGLLLLFNCIPGLSWNLPGAFLCSAALALLLWFLHGRKRRWPLRCSVIALPCIGAFLLIRDEALLAQLWKFSLRLLGVSQTAEADVTEGMLFVSCGLVYLFFVLEFLFHTHWLVYGITTFFLLAAPFLGIVPNIGAVLCLAIFQTVFWAVRRLLKQERYGGKAARKISALIAAGIVTSFAFSLLLVGQNPGWFYQTAYEAEGFFQRLVKQARGNAMNPEEGIINRGNLYPAGIEQLELWVNEQPTETLYLKEFSGGEYSNGEWLRADDTVIFSRMEENTLHWGQWESWIPDMYDSLYYALNASVIREEALPQRVLRISYKDFPSNDADLALPYYGMWQRGQREQRDEEYEVRYFQSDEIDINWEGVVGTIGEARDWYFELQEAYLKETDVYTAVPEEALPRLKQLCEKNPQNSLEEITAFILSVLDRASYTTTPGLIPVNQDPTEYFLFESGAGYCQHFASAAALMYRFYGIPARYATGYAVPPSAFERQADGSYYAMITDEAAHAWPEIFLENYGWVPVEVTPSADLSANSYTGMDLSVLQGLLERQSEQPELSAEQLLTESDAEEQNAFSDSNAFESSGFPRFKMDPIWLILLLPISVAFFLIYRKTALQNVEYMDIRRLYDRMLRAIHWTGILKEYDGSEPDFPKKLSETLKLPSGLVQEAFSHVSQAAYGSGPPSESGQSAMGTLYWKVTKALYAQLPWWKKIWFKFFKVFC